MISRFTIIYIQKYGTVDKAFEEGKVRKFRSHGVKVGVPPPIMPAQIGGGGRDRPGDMSPPPPRFEGGGHNIKCPPGPPPPPTILGLGDY